VLSEKNVEWKLVFVPDEQNPVSLLQNNRIIPTT